MLPYTTCINFSDGEMEKKINKNWYTGTILMDLSEVRNSQVTKSSYEIKLHKMASHFEILTRTFLQKFIFRVTNSILIQVDYSTLLNFKFHFE